MRPRLTLLSIITLASFAMQAAAEPRMAPIVQASHTTVSKAANHCSTCGDKPCGCVTNRCAPACASDGVCGSCGPCSMNACSPCSVVGCRGCGLHGHCRHCGGLFGHGHGYGDGYSGGCLNTCNMPPHYPYFPADHGYYYFRPYNYRHIAMHQQAVVRYGGDPRHPYANEVFGRVYEALGETELKEVIEEALEQPMIPVPTPIPVPPPADDTATPPVPPPDAETHVERDAAPSFATYLNVPAARPISDRPAANSIRVEFVKPAE